MSSFIGAREQWADILGDEPDSADADRAIEHIHELGFETDRAATVFVAAAYLADWRSHLSDRTEVARLAAVVTSQMGTPHSYEHEPRALACALHRSIKRVSLSSTLVSDLLDLAGEDLPARGTMLRHLVDVAAETPAAMHALETVLCNDGKLGPFEWHEIRHNVLVVVDPSEY